MKPIEKYQEKFIELLKEAEEELGDYLTIKVASRKRMKDATRDYATSYSVVEEKIYDFSLNTSGVYI